MRVDEGESPPYLTNFVLTRRWKRRQGTANKIVLDIWLGLRRPLALFNADVIRQKVRIMYKKLWDMLKDEIDKGIAAYNIEHGKTDKDDDVKNAWIVGGKNTLIEVRSYMDMIQSQENISENFFNNNALQRSAADALKNSEKL